MSFEQTQPVQLQAETLRFNGNGGEYFRIWIVNLLLSIITLGIYSAWAKVRRLQYFYGNTELAGSSFSYEGDPVAILKGRIIALVLFTAYNLSIKISFGAFVVTLVLLAAVLPWLLRNAFRFRLHNSSYRGLRFRFTGDNAGAYKTFLLYGPFAVFTLYLAAPLFHQRLKRYQHDNARFGQTPFAFSASVGQFYAAYFVIALLMIATMVGAFVPFFSLIAKAQTLQQKPDPVAMASAAALMLAVLVGGMLMIQPLWLARIQNLVWNHTTLGPHRFESKASAWSLFGIFLTNLLGIVFTLGLFTPWAAVRLARYRAQTVSLIPGGSLDDFIADQEQEMSAAGQETAEFMDIDIGL
jgi:uncharacterized membrane protein YjgN (DUF898 family)